MSAALGQCRLDPAQTGQVRFCLVEQIFDHWNVGFAGDTGHQPLGDMPFLAGNNIKRAIRTDGRLCLPETRGVAAAKTPASGQKAQEAPPVTGNVKGDILPAIQRTKAILQRACLWADLAGEQKILRQKIVIVVIVKGCGQSVVREHQKRQRPRADFAGRHQIMDDGLKKRLVRDPCGAEKPHDVRAAVAKPQNPLDGAAAQAPPLAANHDLQIGRDRAGQTKAFLHGHAGVEKPLVCTLVEVVTIDQALFLDPGPDPVTFKKVKCFNIVAVIAVQIVMRKTDGLDRHAVARHHVKMRGLRKGRDRSPDRQKRSGNQRPSTPAAADSALGKGDTRIGVQCCAQRTIVCRRRAFVEMDRHIVPGTGQPLGLLNDAGRVLVAKKYV